MPSMEIIRMKFMKNFMMMRTMRRPRRIEKLGEQGNDLYYMYSSFKLT